MSSIVALLLGLTIGICGVLVVEVIPLIHELNRAKARKEDPVHEQGNVEQCSLCDEPLLGCRVRKTLKDEKGQDVPVCSMCWTLEVAYDDYMLERFEEEKKSQRDPDLQEVWRTMNVNVGPENLAK